MFSSGHHSQALCQYPSRLHVPAGCNWAVAATWKGWGSGHLPVLVVAQPLCGESGFEQLTYPRCADVYAGRVVLKVLTLPGWGPVSVGWAGLGAWTCLGEDWLLS